MLRLEGEKRRLMPSTYKGCLHMLEREEHSLWMPVRILLKQKLVIVMMP